MFNFNFYNPTRIIFGKDRLAALDKLVPADARVLLTFGSESAKKFGTLDRVKAALGDREIHEFGGIEPNPRYETLMEAVHKVREENLNFLLAVGGGSVIDGTKFIALAAPYDNDTVNLLLPKPRPETAPRKAVDLGTVLTLPATGSEMNNGAVISYGDGKYVFVNDLVFPKFSILDPTLTYTLPREQVANGIVDSFVHVAEAYMTFPVDAKIQDRLSEGIFRTLIEIADTTLNEPENYDARANLVWSATLALNGITGTGVPQDWTSHLIGHELTAMFGIDHGKSLAVIFPAVLEVRREQKRAKLLQYANRVWNVTDGSENSRIDKAIFKTRDFFESLGVKTHLTDYNIGKDKLDSIVKKLEEHGFVALSETRDLSPDISRKILEAAL